MGRIVAALCVVSGLWGLTGHAEVMFPPPGDTGMKYLLSVDPSLVTWAEMSQRMAAVEANYVSYHELHGVNWPAMVSDPATMQQPDRYVNGGDSALFTGYYLATASFRNAAEPSAANYARVLSALRGIHLLTHLSGVPGVIARCAFPIGMEAKFDYPASWQHRIDGGKVYDSLGNVPDFLAPGSFHPPMHFYTNASRDQLSGIMFGLSVAWLTTRSGSADDERVRDGVAQIADAIYGRLRSTNWSLRDHGKKSGKLGAENVTGLLKLQVLGMVRAVEERRAAQSGDWSRYKRQRKHYTDQFKKVFGFFGGSLADWFNFTTNYFQYYTWNLRFARTFTIYWMDSDQSRRGIVEKYASRYLWKNVERHENPFFTFVYRSIRPSTSDLAPAFLQLKGLSSRPLREWSSPLVGVKTAPPWNKALFGDISKYVVPGHLKKPRDYFAWGSEPWDVGSLPAETQGLSESSGIDRMLPYWMGRYFGLIPAN